MNTEQSNTSKRNSTNPIEQTAKSMSEQSDLYQAERSLLDVVDKYMINSGAVEAINTMLEHWLTDPTTDLSQPANKVRLSQILQLSSFLVELKASHETVLVTSELDG